LWRWGVSTHGWAILERTRFAGRPMTAALLAIRSINRQLYRAIPPPASAENLQEDFSSRLNKDLRRIASSAAVGRRRLRVTIVDGLGIADVLVIAGESPRRKSPCFASSAAGPRDCLTAPVGTAACVPAAAAQFRRSSTRLRAVRLCVFIYS
jgi:hypothetical protein